MSHSKRILMPVLALLLAVVPLFCSLGGLLFARAAVSTPPVLTAPAYILIEQSSGKVLHGHNMYQQMYPASTTKIMTAMLALDNLQLEDSITLPDDFINVGETSLGLLPGATQNVEELLMAMMLRSANDAAQAVAIGVSGSEEAFVEQMNARVAELGLSHTHFVNPHGLHDANHYTTAYDLAQIARAALDNPDFCRIINTESCTVHKLNGEDDFEVYNRNNLLTQYELADGVKTGYTKQAGNCFVASATNAEGMQLIAVVLSSENIYDDAQALLEWGFDNFGRTLIVDANTVKGSLPVLNGGREQVAVLTEKPLYFIGAPEEAADFAEDIELPASITAPVHRGEVVGALTYTDANGDTYSTNLLAAKDVGKYSLKLVVRQSFQSVWQVFVVPFS